jgi:O-antigen ligase
MRQWLCRSRTLRKEVDQMKLEKLPLWGGVVLVVLFVFYLAYTHPSRFTDVGFLAGILLAEIVIAFLYKYEKLFFLLLMLAFLWAAIDVPMRQAWVVGRWVVLAGGALVGCIIWMRTSRKPFGLFHFIALSCVCSATISVMVSPFPQMTLFKALSLLLLFTYSATGARLAVLGREDRFFSGLLLGCEIAVYLTAICYFALGVEVWGNRNSLGAAMSIGAFPCLLWGWLTSDSGGLRQRRLVALLLSLFLVFFSMARAGMVAVLFVALLFCVCLRQYKLLFKALAGGLCLVAVTGVLAPAVLTQSVGDIKNAVLYKGHEEEGVLGSRREPWERTVSTIKQHPFFGTGYGTSLTGMDPSLSLSKFASSSATVREHGNSYMTVLEWVGLLGVFPFVALLMVIIVYIWRVCVWMRRTSDASHYAVPLAMVLLAGLAHATFEDWLFAVGSYSCVFFWVFAFILADLVPSTSAASFPRDVTRLPYPVASGFVAAPNR